MEKFGFVYIWRDRKRKMFYVGCHWGTEADGYICSSRRMRKAYNRRPNDFKRRVIARVTERSLLLPEEFKWLSLIPDSELSKKFYNMSKHHFGHWSASPDARTIAQKIRDAPGRREKISAAHKGKKLSPEHIEKMRQMHLGRKHSPEEIAKRTASIKAVGKIYTAEGRQRISDAHKGKKLSPEHRAKISARQLGTVRGPLSRETKQKIYEAKLKRNETQRI